MYTIVRGNVNEVSMKKMFITLAVLFVTVGLYAQTNDQISDFGIEIYGYGDSGYLINFDHPNETTYPTVGVSGGVYFERGKLTRNFSFLMNLAFRVVYSTGYPNLFLTSFESDWWMTDLHLAVKFHNRDRIGPYATAGLFLSYNGYTKHLINSRIELGWLFKNERELNLFTPTLFAQYEVQPNNLKIGITARYRYNLYKGFSTKNITKLSNEKPATGFMLQFINELRYDGSYYLDELFFYTGLSASVEVFLNSRVSFHTDFSFKVNTGVTAPGENKHLIIGLEPHIRYYSQYSDFFIGIGTPLDFYIPAGGDSLPEEQSAQFDINLDLGWRYRFGVKDNIPLDIIIGNRMMGLLNPYVKVQIGYLFGK